MEVVNYRDKVRNGTLYRAIDELITKEFAILEKQIQDYIDASDLDLEVYTDLKSSPFQLEHITNWSLNICFDDYQWSYVLVKPHWMDITISLEEIIDKDNCAIRRTASKKISENNTLILSFGSLRNSFELHSKDYKSNKKRKIRETHINLANLENEKIINEELAAIKKWLKTIYTQFTKGIDIIDRNDLILNSDWEKLCES